jgi:TubC N-terminal docking domain
MVTDELLAELRARSVTLRVQEGQLVTTAPKGTITPELREQIMAHKAVLLKALTPPPTLLPLPEPLARLVHAAKVNGLNRPGFIPSGMVPNLGEYVLTCAALYACNWEPDRQLSDLWVIRKSLAA